MRLKKSVFGYVNFTIGTVIMSVYLYTLFVSLLRTYEESAGRRVYFYGVGLPLILAAVAVLAVAGLYFLISFIKSKISVKESQDGSIVSTVIYWFFFALLFSYGLFVRITHLKVIKDWGTIQNYTDNTSNPGYWKNLLSLFYGNEVSFDNFFHKLYSFIAALLLRIFGDTLTVPAVLNIILYMLASIMLFMAAKYIFGRMASLLVFAALMLSHVTVGLIYEIAGFNLFFITISLIIFLITYFLDVYTGSKPVMCYVISVIALAGVVVFNHFVYKPFVFKSIFNIDIFAITPENMALHSLVCITVLTVFALFAYLSLFKNNDDEISFANILFVTMLVIHIFDKSTNNTFWFAVLGLCVLAGIGADNLLFKNYKKALETAEVKDLQECEPNEAPDIPVNFKDTDESKLPATQDAEASGQDVKVPKPDTEAPEENTEILNHSNADTPEFKESEKPKVPRYFETPLPMPKKHVKKSIDYAFEPSEDLMKYDVEISSDDDFDIK